MAVRSVRNPQQTNRTARSSMDVPYNALRERIHLKNAIWLPWCGAGDPAFRRGPGQTLGCYFSFSPLFKDLAKEMPVSVCPTYVRERRESKDSRNKDHISRGTILSPIEQVSMGRHTARY